MTDRLIDLLRHGKVQGGGRFRGAHDDPLTEPGWAQMQRACDTFPSGQTDAGWDLILCSPARRCAAFAARLGAKARGLPVEPLAALHERDFGAWEGRTAADIPIAELSRFSADPSYDPPGAEPFAALQVRVATTWAGLRDGVGRHPLLITHGGVVRVILGEVLRLTADRLLLIEVPPACRTRLRLPVGGGGQA